MGVAGALAVEFSIAAWSHAEGLDDAAPSLSPESSTTMNNISRRGTVLAFGALVGMPILFGAAGFTSGALAGAIVVGTRVILGEWDLPRGSPCGCTVMQA